MHLLGQTTTQLPSHEGGTPFLKVEGTLFHRDKEKLAVAKKEAPSNELRRPINDHERGQCVQTKRKELASRGSKRV